MEREDTRLSEKREMSSVDKLVSVEEQTNDDGTVNVTIDSWEETDGGGINVSYVTPTGDVKTDQMGFPQPGEELERCKFYQLLQEADLSMRNADLLEGSIVRARLSGGGWSLVADPPKTKKEQATTLATKGAQKIRDAPLRSYLIAGLWVTLVVGLLLVVVL